MSIAPQIFVRHYITSRKIFDARREKFLILVARDVLGDVGADALGVTHFAENFSARVSNALNRPSRAVRVEGQGGSRRVVEVNVLRRDLPVVGKFFQPSVARNESALAVTDCD